VSEERWLTPVDVRLLRALAREPNLVHAAHALGLGRDRAVYRLKRLTRLFGRPVALGERGGPHPGGTRLTPLGRRLLRTASGVPPGANLWTGTYRRGPPPTVVFGPGSSLEVSFRAREGSEVTIEVDPEGFVVARRPVTLSARNALRTTIEQVRTHPDGTVTLVARWGERPVRVALTSGAVTRLGLTTGTRAYLYVKAVAVRRAPSPGSLRS
jgi:molybdopterin-binding protein/molybdate transport repressor ModE-like protein